MFPTRTASPEMFKGSKDVSVFTFVLSYRSRKAGSVLFFTPASELNDMKAETSQIFGRSKEVPGKAEKVPEVRLRPGSRCYQTRLMSSAKGDSAD